MAEIVVTGGQGFLGKALTDRLINMGEDVCSTYCYTPPWKSSKGNLSHFKLDVTNFNECLKLINQENPKIIYHLVAQPLVTSAIRHPYSTLELTIRGTYNLLEAVRQSNKDIRVVLYTSDKVYGNNDNAKEGDRLDTVSHPYEVAKVCEDMLGRSYALSFDMDVVTIRSGNLYGEGDLHWDRIVPYMCKSVVLGSDIVFRGTGKQKRDYIYVDDAIDGILLSKKLSSGDSMNLGAKDSYTAFELFEKLQDVVGTVKHPIATNISLNEIDSQHINFQRASNLGWFPKTDIKTGLEKTFAWYKEWFRHE